MKPDHERMTEMQQQVHNTAMALLRSIESGANDYSPEGLRMLAEAYARVVAPGQRHAG